MDNIYKLRYFDYVETDDDIWFSNLYFNALIKLNKKSGRIQMMDKFPNHDVGQEWLYTAVFKIDGQLVFVPNRSEEIVTYNIETGKYVCSPLDLDIIGKSERYFLSAYAYKQYVYMFPVRTKYIVRYDVLNHSTKYLDNGLSVALSDLPDMPLCFSTQYEVVENKIYIPFLKLNAIAVFEPEKESLNIRYLDIDGGCSTINYMDGYFYLASYTMCKIYRWNEKTGEVKTYNVIHEETVTENCVFISTCIMDGKIFFLPLQGNDVLSFDMVSEKLCVKQKILNTDKEAWDVYFSKRTGNSYLTMTADEDDLCLTDYREELLFSPYFKNDILYNKKKISSYLLNHQYFNIVWERDKSLELYIEVIKLADDNP